MDSVFHFRDSVSGFGVLVLPELRQVTTLFKFKRARKLRRRMSSIKH